MTTRRVVLIGGPDSGKTNFIARFWVSALQPSSMLAASGSPDDIRYVEEILAHILQGGFAPRTDTTSEHALELELSSENDEDFASLIIPDVSGELWHDAVQLGELPQTWMNQLSEATGALIFVRVQSDVNVSRLDWVTSSELMALQGDGNDEEQEKANEVSTQVNLCEYVRFLEHTMRSASVERKCRIAVLVTAWDLLDPVTAAQGPFAYIEKEYPLFAGRVQDADEFEFAFYAVSVTGGDPVVDEEFKDTLLNSDFETVGYVKRKIGEAWSESTDFTTAIAWTIGMDGSETK